MVVLVLIPVTVIKIRNSRIDKVLKMSKKSGIQFDKIAKDNEGNYKVTNAEKDVANYSKGNLTKV